MVQEEYKGDQGVIGSAKPLFPGSNLGGASKKMESPKDLITRLLGIFILPDLDL